MEEIVNDIKKFIVPDKCLTVIELSSLHHAQKSIAVTTMYLNNHVEMRKFLPDLTNREFKVSKGHLKRSFEALKTC